MSWMSELVLMCNVCRARVFLAGLPEEALLGFCAEHKLHDTQIADWETHPSGVDEWVGSWGHKKNWVDYWEETK